MTGEETSQGEERAVFSDRGQAKKQATKVGGSPGIACPPSINRHNLFYRLGFIFSSIARPSQDKDLGVINETVSDSGGHRGGIKDLSPVGKGQVSSQQR